MVGVNFLGMLMYAPPLRRKFGCISNYLLIFRVPLLAISHLYLSLLVRDNSHIPQMVQCSQIWAESAAIEKLVGVLVWQCLFPLFAAFPFYIAVITMTANVYITFGAIFNMCYFAFDMCPKSSVQYLLLSKIFAYADILFPTAIADAADQLDLPRCSKSLGWIQVS